jgi:hypothetical protein
MEITTGPRCEMSFQRQSCLLIFLRPNHCFTDPPSMKRIVNWDRNLCLGLRPAERGRLDLKTYILYSRGIQFNPWDIDCHD